MFVVNSLLLIFGVVLFFGIKGDFGWFVDLYNVFGDSKVVGLIVSLLFSMFFVIVLLFFG